MGRPRGPYRSRLELTSRQRDVMRLMADSKTNGEIAGALGITLDGAKWHVSEILAKLDVSSREEAVAVWRAYNRPTAQLRRMAGALAGQVAAIPVGIKLAGAVAAVLVVTVAGAVALWPQQESESVRAEPETPEQLLRTMAEVLGEDGQVLELEATWTIEGTSGEREEYGSFKAWFAFEEESARIEFHKGPDNDLDIAEYWTAWFVAQDVYQQGPDDNSPRRMDFHEVWPSCLGIGPALVEVLVCGLFPSSIHASNVQVRTEEEWRGRRALALVFEEAVTEGTIYAFYLDKDSFLPLALVVTYQRDGEPVGETRLEFDSELLKANDVDSSVFDPRAAGYQTPDEEEMEVLDNPRGGGPVWWLGREFDAGPQVGVLRLHSAKDWYHPERPTHITLEYRGTDGAGRVAIDTWKDGAWQAFMAKLQEFDNNSGRFPFGAACTLVEDFEAAGYQARLIAGYNYEYREPTGVVVTTPGATPPTATPFPTEPCPGTPHDEFMVEVYIQGYVVTVNAPIGIFERGEPYEAYDTPENLQAIAAGLRLRQQGE